jgi:CheY-like chemotaxis protein
MKESGMQGAVQGMNILLAEDDPDDRALLRDAFHEAGLRAQLHFVEDGRELLDSLRSSRSDAGENANSAPSLILLDLNMPRMDGHTALARIKEDPDLKKIPVVVLSTSRAREDILRAYDLGANSYIAKPSSFSGLVQTVNTLNDYWLETVTLPDVA